MKRIQHFLPIFLALFLPMGLLFHLQAFPGNADAAELLVTSQLGGIPHPPGFPIQLWMNKFWLLLSPYPAGLTLAFSSWIYFFLGGLLLLFFLRLNRFHYSIQMAALAIFFGFYPSMQMAVNIEKYALLNLLFMSALVFTQAWMDRRKELYFYLALGSIALAFSHHYIAIILLPLLWPLYKNRKEKLSLLLLLIVPTVFYFSLYFLKGDRSWPNWGEVNSIWDTIGYFFAMNHGDHGLSTISLGAAGTLNATGIFLSHLGLLSPLLFLGLLIVWRTRTRLVPLLVPVIFFLILNSLFNRPESLFVRGYFTRYASSALILSILPLSYGMDFLMNKGKPLIRFLLWLLLLVIFSSHLFLAMNNNNPLRVYTEQVQEDWKGEGILLSSDDFLSFYGLNDHQDYPLIPAVYYPWYLKRLKVLSPEVHAKLPLLQNNDKEWDFEDLIKVLYDSGLPLASTERGLFKKIQGPIHQRGSIFLANKNLQLNPFDQTTVKAALKLCSHLIKDPPREIKPWHYFQRWYLSKMVNPFLAAASFHHMNNQAKEKKAAMVIAKALKDGKKDLWQEACKLYKSFN